jgi:hypothetical protein
MSVQYPIDASRAATLMRCRRVCEEEVPFMFIKSKLACAVAGAALAVAVVAAPASASTVVSFETPVPNGGYEYNSLSPFPGPNGNFTSPTAEGVSFTGLSGIQANGSAWGFTNAPDGVQTAFLQIYSGFPANPGSITFSLPTVTNQPYRLVFDVESRPGYGGNAYTVNAGSTSQIFGAPSTTSWSTETLFFTALSNSTNFAISINIPRIVTDNSIGVDAISITATPLPSTWTMLIAGFVALGFFAYRGAKKGSAAVAAA